MNYRSATPRGSLRRALLPKAILGICAAITAGYGSAPATAQVQLPTVNLGDTNFEDGFAGRGLLVEEFPDVYFAGESKDSTGATVPGKNTLSAISTTTHIAYISNKRLFGAWIGAETLVVLADADVNLASGIHVNERGFADPIFGPFALQWDPKKVGPGIFVHRFVLDLTAPIGKYSDQRPVNIGNHFVMVNPYYALTYEWPHKLEVSARLHYLWNSANNDPFVGFGIRNMQPGQAFHMNYSASYEVLRNLRLGFNGYWLQQLTDHEINGIAVPNSKERTVGLGPGLQLGGRDIWFHLDSYLETDVRNRPSGVKVTLRITKAIPAKGNEH